MAPDEPTAGDVSPSPSPSPSPSSENRGGFGGILIEAGLVVLGVVLAFAANEWHQARADEEHAAVVLNSIYEEIETNRKLVQESFDYHRGLLVELQRLEEPPPLSLFSRGFISPAPVLRTAWDSAASTDALRFMDYSVVLELSRLYAWQDRYEIQASGVSEALYELLLNEGKHGILRRYDHLSGLISTFSYRENQLLERYDEVASGADGGEE